MRGRGVIVASGRNAVPFIYISDVVQGLLLALDEPSAVGQMYTITTDEPLTQQELMDAIAHEIGARPPRLHVPYHALLAAGHGAERFASLTRSMGRPPVPRLVKPFLGTDTRYALGKARRELGYRPRVPLREGIRLAATWYLNRGVAPTGTPAAVGRLGE